MIELTDLGWSQLGTRYKVLILVSTQETFFLIFLSLSSSQNSFDRKPTPHHAQETSNNFFCGEKQITMSLGISAKNSYGSWKNASVTIMLNCSNSSSSSTYTPHFHDDHIYDAKKINEEKRKRVVTVGIYALSCLSLLRDDDYHCCCRRLCCFSFLGVVCVILKLGQLSPSPLTPRSPPSSRPHTVFSPSLCVWLGEMPPQKI